MELSGGSHGELVTESETEPELEVDEGVAAAKSSGELEAGEQVSNHHHYDNCVNVSTRSVIINNLNLSFSK